MKKVQMLLIMALIVSALGTDLMAQATQPAAQATTRGSGAEKPEYLISDQPTPQVVKEAPSESWFEFSTRWSDKYVAPFDKLVYDHPVQQTDVTVWLPKVDFLPGRFYADIWDSASFRGTMNSDPGDEIDYTLGWKGTIFEKVTLNTWFTFLDLQPIGEVRENSDQIRFFTEFDRTFSLTKDHSLTPFWRMEFPWSVHDAKDTHGVRSYLGLRHGWEFLPGWTLGQKIDLVFDDGACGLRPATLWDYKVGVTWQVAKWCTIEPASFRVISPFGNPGDGRECETIFSSGVAFRF